MRSPSQSGLSLVELMVAVTVSLFLLAGVMQVFLGSRQSYRTSDALAWVQESGRFALDLISRDLRQAGHSRNREICGGSAALSLEQPVTNDGILDLGRLRIALNEPATNGAAWTGVFAGIANAIRGYDATAGGWAPGLPSAVAALNPSSGTDVLRIQTSQASQQPSIRIAEHLPGSGIVRVMDAAQELQDGDRVMVVDRGCEVGAVFQLTGLTPGSDPDWNRELAYSAGSGTPGNRTVELGRDFTGGNLLLGPDTPQSVTYYLAPNANGVPALFRSTNDAAGEELVEGVADMQIQYGVDTDDDDNVDQYDLASTVTDWDRVRAVRVGLLVRSPEGGVTAEGENQVLTFDGAVVDTSDRRLRSVFTTTVAVRSRLP